MRVHWDIYETPQTVEEALDRLAEYREEAAIIAGGTDLIVDLDQNDGFHQTLIDVSHISGLGQINTMGDEVSIGANVTLSDILHAPAIRDLCPYLVGAIETIGSVQIRNIATLVGNIANASPAADGVLPLLALDSYLVLKSHRGERQVPLRTFFTGPGQTVSKPDELITEVRFEKPGSNSAGAFEKIGFRHAMAIAIVNAAAFVALEEGRVVEARIALGSVAPTPVLASDAEQFLLRTSLQERDVKRASELVQRACSPIDDVRSGAEYRKKMVKTLTFRVLTRIREQFDSRQGRNRTPDFEGDFYE